MRCTNAAMSPAILSTVFNFSIVNVGDSYEYNVTVIPDGVTVLIKGTRCDGIIDCWNGEAKQNKYSAKQIVQLILNTASYDGLSIRCSEYTENNLESMDDIRSLGIEKFNGLCKDTIKKYSNSF